MDGVNLIGEVSHVQCDDVTNCIRKIDDEIASVQKEVVESSKLCDWDRAYEYVYEYDRLNEIKNVLVAIRNMKAEVV